jgi:Glucose-6-phosphate dehydrogenase, NAD binding domain
MCVCPCCGTNCDVCAATAVGDSLAIVVVGASGDLAKKKTFPALYELFLANLLPRSTILFGYARSEMAEEKFLVGKRFRFCCSAPVWMLHTVCIWVFAAFPPAVLGLDTVSSSF